MNLGNIVSPNEKGQIVIPKEIRDAMGIISGSYLQLIYSGSSIILNPIKAVVTVQDLESSYKDILKKTAGTWSNDNFPQTRKKRRKIELEAITNNKKVW